MGIYYGNDIRGVRIINPQNTSHILYEAVYTQDMSESELRLFFTTYETYASKRTYVPWISVLNGFTTTYEHPMKSGWTWEMKHSLQEMKDMFSFT